MGSSFFFFAMTGHFRTKGYLNQHHFGMVQRTEFFFIFNFTINAIEGRFDDLCGIATSTSKRTFFLLKNELKTVYLVITGRKPGKKVQNLKKGPLFY